VKEKRPIVIQRNFAAWIALYRTSRTHGNAYWTFNGRAVVIWESSYIFEYLSDCATAFGTRTPMLITSTKVMIRIILSLIILAFVAASSRGILSPSPLLALLYDFVQIRNRPYLIRSKFILHAAWML
jgi:hypothetical protein